MKLECARAMALAEQLESGLDPAQRIWLEGHLGECRNCAEQTALLEGLGDALRKPDWSLKPRARDAVLERALRAPRDRAQVESSSRRRAVLALAAAAAVAAAVALVVRPRPEPSRLQALGPAFRALTVQAPEPPPPPARADDACEPIRAAGIAGTWIQLTNAKVEVLRASRLCWRRDAATLDLGAGALRVEVVKGSPSGFRVATERFVVQVVGTAFDVDTESVRVIRGKVQILAPKAAEPLALLGPGQSWSLQDTKAPVVSTADVTARLAQARRQIAAGRIAAARSELRQLSRGALEPLQRAELQSLLAECSLVEGKLDDAARAYGEVANRHAGTLTGETALFAQARAELRAGRRDAARARLRSYLARYPNGRFRREALGHLRSIEEKL
jgi:hypothetical protein